MNTQFILRRLMYILLLAVAGASFADAGEGNVLWDEYISLRDGVYNGAETEDVADLYDAAVQGAYRRFTGDELLVALSRCNYMMGRAFSYAGEKEQAGTCYDAGVAYAEQALELGDSALANLMYGENISQNCSVKPVSYALYYGSRIGGIAKDVLKMDPSCGAALYLLNAQHIYAPSPFNNYKKGIREMKAILDDSSVHLEPDDMFNVASAIGYGYMQLGDDITAREWLEKSLQIYPGNKFVKSLLDELSD